jgi:hypothetical protein
MKCAPTTPWLCTAEVFMLEFLRSLWSSAWDWGRRGSFWWGVLILLAVLAILIWMWSLDWPNGRDLGAGHGRGQRILEGPAGPEE